jgi:hypothetical protein
MQGGGAEDEGGLEAKPDAESNDDVMFFPFNFNALDGDGRWRFFIDSHLRR